MCCVTDRLARERLPRLGWVRESPTSKLDQTQMGKALTPEVQAGQTLFGSSSGYSVLEFIGEGCYGKVAKCRNLATKESVAVKILKQDVDFIPDTEKEVSILEVISVLNPDHTNVVKFFERFEHMGQTCLAFEMLDRSLYDLLYERDWKPLALKEIRIIAKQLLVALDALKGLGILHTDIKPDNIMFVNMQDQPFKIKLIDFGEAIPTSKVQLGMELQPTGFRAPEVALGLPFTEAIDVWGVGCVLAFLYLADNLFPVKCDYQMEIKSHTQTNIGMTGLLMKDYLHAPIMKIQLSGLLMEYYLPTLMKKIQLLYLLMKDYLPILMLKIQLSGLPMKDYLPTPLLKIQPPGLLM
ncbi:homeodomain-interacting protein kinase 1-like [Anarrhichthys ocellatus]|uniref:homeodomain-interacting protein kinase 1-like n=1 Tax=Anarrhichthys ocellatus TaxID=433405 RepID=UPI0012EE9AE7|nr:homeodomain-interacting protein kinase 1-like [Anarrhichthys ocellatus]